MTEPNPYGLICFRLQNQRKLADRIRARPWIKDNAESQTDEYKAIRSNRFNVLLSDTCFFERGVSVESVFTVLTNAMPKAVSLEQKPPVGMSTSVAPFQIINHLPCSVALTNKAALVRSLQRHYQGTSTHPFDVMPVTYYFPRGTRSDGVSPTLSQFYKRFTAVGHGQTEGLRLPGKHAACNLWTVKHAGGNPGAMLLVNTAEDAASAIATMTADFVIQKYIERPLLVAGCKVTIRLLVLVTDSADVYVHRSGLVQLASDPYAPASTAALGGMARSHAVHVTSSEVQAPCAGYGRMYPGNTMSLDDLQVNVDRSANTNALLPHAVVHEVVVPRMKRIVVDAVRGAMAATMPGDPDSTPIASGQDADATINLGATASAGHPRAGFRGRRCFELLAADFVIDEDLRPWLMGFSENPDMSVVASVNTGVAALVEHVAEEVVALAVDPLLPAPALPAVADTSALPTPGFSPSNYSALASGVPTGVTALEAASRSQARLAGALAHATTGAASSKRPMTASYVPFSPALPAGESSPIDPLPLPGFELAYRSMAAEDIESASYVAMACAALAPRGSSSSGDGMALSSAVCSQINEALCVTLPPRARTLDTVPQWAFTGPAPPPHSMAWLAAAGGAQAVLPSGHVLVESSSPNARGVGGRVAPALSPTPIRTALSPAFLPPPSSPSFSLTSPLSVTGAPSPSHSELASKAGWVQDRAQPPVGDGSSPVDVQAAATAIALFLAKGGPEPLSAAMKLAMTLEGAVNAGQGSTSAAGLPGGLTNAGLLQALQAAIPAIASVALAAKAKQKAEKTEPIRKRVASTGPDGPQTGTAAFRQSSNKAPAAGSGTGYGHVGSRVNTGQRASSKAAAGALHPRVHGRVGTARVPSSSSSTSAQLADPSSTLAPHSSGEEEAAGPAFQRATSTSAGRANSPGTARKISNGQGSRIPVLSSRKSARQGTGHAYLSDHDFDPSSRTMHVQFDAQFDEPPEDGPMNGPGSVGGSGETHELAAMLATLLQPRTLPPAPAAALPLPLTPPPDARSGRGYLLPPEDIDSVALPAREGAMGRAMAAVQAARSAAAIASAATAVAPQAPQSTIHYMPSQPTPAPTNEFSAYTSLASYMSDKAKQARGDGAPVQAAVRVEGSGRHALSAAGILAGQSAAASLAAQYQYHLLPVKREAAHAAEAYAGSSTTGSYSALAGGTSRAPAPAAVSTVSPSQIWVAVPTSTGMYYYNAASRQSVWERPVGVGVVCVTQEDMDFLA